MGRPSKKTLWIAGAATALVLVTGVGAAAYAAHYADIGLPRASVAGVSVSGLTHDQIAEAVDARASQAVLTATVSGTTTELRLADLGITVDAQASADRALAANASIVARLTAPFHTTQTPLVYSLDEDTLARTGSDLALAAGPATVESGVSPDADQGMFVATRGRTGKGIDTASLKEAATELAETLAPSSTEFTASDVEPAISYADAVSAAETANRLISPEVSVTDGIDTYTAGTEDKLKWVAITAHNGALQAPTVDRAGVSAWVEATAKSTNVEAKGAIDNVDAQGNVLVRSFPGSDGLEVDNADEVTSGIVSALESSSDYEGDFDYTKTTAPTTTMPAMPGYESYAYPAHEGEKWVDINLANSTLTAYEGQTVVHGPVDINHGGVGHETIVGTFHVYQKHAAQDMGCTPEWPYCARGVPWVSYFEGSYAMHGAPWVARFGIGSDASSHGCINMPVEEAHWMYDWDEIGTAVVTHY